MTRIGIFAAIVGFSLVAHVAVAETKQLDLKLFEAAVHVKLEVPAGWTDNHSDSFANYQSPGMGRSSIGVDLGCMGHCFNKTQLDKVKKQIATSDKEHFDFVSKSNHIPQLTAKWVQPLKEESPGVFVSRWTASGENQEQHFNIYRLVPNTGMVLTCHAEITEVNVKAPKESIELLATACRIMQMTTK